MLNEFEQGRNSGEKIKKNICCVKSEGAVDTVNKKFCLDSKKLNDQEGLIGLKQWILRSYSKPIQRVALREYQESLASYRPVWFITFTILVWFYGISTIVGYLMPNPIYTYISNI